MNDEKNLLGIIGICRGAGKAVIGTDMVCELLQKRSAKNKCKNDGKLDIIVIEASDTIPYLFRTVRSVPLPK